MQLSLTVNITKMYENTVLKILSTTLHFHWIKWYHNFTFFLSLAQVEIMKLEPSPTLLSSSKTRRALTDRLGPGNSTCNNPPVNGANISSPEFGACHNSPQGIFLTLKPRRFCYVIKLSPTSILWLGSRGGAGRWDSEESLHFLAVWFFGCHEIEPQ